MTMKTVLFGFLFSVILCQQSISQELMGRYSNSMEFIDFKANGIVDFKLNTGGGLIHEYNGSGKYQIKAGFLKITLAKVPEPYSVMKSVEKLSTPDSVTFYVFDAQTNKPFDGPVTVLLLKDSIIIAHGFLQNSFIRFSQKECIRGVELQMRYLGYPRFSKRFTSNAKSDYRVDFSEYPSPEQTQAFLMDEGDGLAIKFDGEVLLMRKKNGSVVIPNIERPKYNWIEFKKEK